MKARLPVQYQCLNCRLPIPLWRRSPRVVHCSDECRIEHAQSRYLYRQVLARTVDYCAPFRVSRRGNQGPRLIAMSSNRVVLRHLRLARQELRARALGER
jgi:hypothetical protein